MREPKYFDTFKTSWHLATRHKLLWIFGLFSFFLGHVGFADVFLKLGLTGTNYSTFPLLAVMPEFFARPSFSQFALTPSGWLMLLWLGVICIGLCLFLFFIAGVSQGALMYSVAEYEKWGHKEPKIGEAWHHGVRHVWQVLMIAASKKVVLSFLSLSLAYALFNALVDARVGDAWLFVVLFVLALIVALISSVLAIYTTGYAVIEGLSLRDAVAHGWQLFTSHWLVSFEVGVLLFFFELAVWSVFVLAFLFLLLPTILLWAFAISAVSKVLSVFAVVIGLSLFSLFVATVVAWSEAVILAAWTHLFLQMHRHGLGGKLLHLGGFLRK